MATHQIELPPHPRVVISQSQESPEHLFSSLTVRIPPPTPSVPAKSAQVSPVSLRSAPPTSTSRVGTWGTSQRAPNAPSISPRPVAPSRRPPPPGVVFPLSPNSLAQLRVRRNARNSPVGATARSQRTRIATVTTESPFLPSLPPRPPIPSQTPITARQQGHVPTTLPQPPSKVVQGQG
jgi:hypothetical protein